MRSLAFRYLPAALLLIHAALILASLRLHSVTIDEAAHIPSGISHWETGSFEAYRVNPPLPRMLAVLPVLVAGPNADNSILTTTDPTLRVEFPMGKDFATWNRDRYHDLVCLARLMGVFWSVLGGWVLYRWGCELFGGRAGLLPLAVWCFEPNVLAHAQLATPDLPSAVAGLTAAYLFWQYLRASSWRGAWLAGLGMGLAQLTKFTLIVLYPTWLILALAYRWRWPAAEDGASPKPTWGQMAFLIGVSVLVINLGYEFRQTGRPLGELPFVSRLFAGESRETASVFDPRPGFGNRFAGTWLGEVPVPLPADYVCGIDVQRKDFEEMHRRCPSYLGGQWQERGWWYYYLYAMGVKMPLGVLGLVLGGFAVTLVKRSGLPWQDRLVVWLPGIAILVLVSSQTGFSHHMRYALPFFPFAILGTAALAQFWCRRTWEFGAVVFGLILFAAISSLSVYPHSLSYFNEAAGGPENGSAHLLDSNIDWGQDLLFLKRWLDEHPEAKPIGLAYFGLISPSIYGIESTRTPLGPDHAPPRYCGPLPGYYAISVNYLRGMHRRSQGSGVYEYFNHFSPIARVGYSLYIYRITPKQADQLRRQLGIDPSPP